MEPEPWTDLHGPMLLALCDVCDALGLSEQERVEILGKLGERALSEVLAVEFAVVG